MSVEPMCDLVLLSWNHLEETRPCLETLFHSIQGPCRLLIVDNASEPEVRAFLRSMTPRGAITEVQLLQNEVNEGFPRGMNRGMRASNAPYVCLLNNDLRFTTGWLQEMVAVAASDPVIGLVNPASSTFGDRPMPGVSLEAHAAARRERFQGQWVEAGIGIGFCLLIKREVVDRVGLLSEEVDRAFFEDEDYSMRVQQAGYRCVVAEGAYVYHAEHRSVRDVPEREALFARNRRWCEQRWGRWVRIAWPRFTPVAPGSEELRRWLEQLVSWARRRAYLYVYAPLPKGVTREALFSSVGLRPHADILWTSIPAGRASLAAAGLILKRRKKRFDIIVAPTAGWGASVSRLRWWHGAAVVPAADEARLTAEWSAARAPR